MNLKYDKSDETDAFNAQANLIRSYVELMPAGELVGHGFRVGMRTHFDGRNAQMTEVNGNVQTEDGFLFGPDTNHSDNGSEGPVPCRIHRAYVQAASPENVTRHPRYAGISTNYHNRFEADGLSARHFPIGLDLVGNNYARLRNYHAHACQIGLRVRNHPVAGGATDCSIDAFHLSRSNVGILIDDRASSKNPYGLVMSNLHIQNGYSNTSDTCHVALISVAPNRRSNTRIHIANMGHEYLHGNSVRSEADWHARAPFPYEYTDFDTGLLVRKVIPPCGVYIESGTVEFDHCDNMDANVWAGVVLDGPHAKLVAQGASIGGSQHGFGIMSQNGQGSASVGSIGGGIYNNLGPEWPSSFPMYEGFSGRTTCADGVPTSERVTASTQYPRLLAKGISAILPDFKPAGGLKMTRAPQSVIDTSFPINGGKVRKYSIAADAWDDGVGYLSIGGENGILGGDGHCGTDAMLPYTWSILIKVDADRPITLAYDAFNDNQGHFGRITLLPGQWKRIFQHKEDHWKMWPKLWSMTRGVKMDISVTRLAPWVFGPGAQDIYSRVLQKGLWVE